MRTFFQGRGDSVVINGDISVTVFDIDSDGDEVMLAIDAPEWVAVNGIEAGRLGDAVEEWGSLQPR